MLTLLRRNRLGVRGATHYLGKVMPSFRVLGAVYEELEPNWYAERTTRSRNWLEATLNQIERELDDQIAAGRPPSNAVTIRAGCWC